MIRVGASGWAGEGLFAAETIAAGTRVLAYQGERISKAESARRRLAGNNYIFHLDYAHDIDGAALENTARYVNHSCDPNCRIELSGGEIWIVADRDLNGGEELSFNYGYDLSEYERFPCSCGARNCCGYMLAREYWGHIPVSRENYEGLFEPWGKPTLDMSDDLISLLLSTLEEKPDNDRVRVQVVTQLLKARRYEEAMEHATPLRVTEHKALAKLAGAHLANAQGEVEAARVLYKEAITGDRKLIDEQLETELEGVAKVPVSGREDDQREAHENENRLRVTFAEIGGMEALKEKIRLNILYPLQKPEIYAAYGKKIGGGLLLYGPPGCGKTHLARATAGEIGANFYLLSLNEVLSMWIGESEKQLANLFKTARDNAPSVIFIDEVDALGGKRSDMHSHHSRSMVSQFLIEMDGMVSENQKVMVLGATNMPWNVDSALRRPGRFDKVLFVPPPDKPAREQILGIHTKGRKIDGSVRLGDIAAKTDHFSGADLAHLVELATERALSEALKSGNLRDITNSDFQAALKETKPSTMEWLRRAKNYVNFANQDGMYDDLDQYLEKARIR